jgi:hypothetical protein
LRGFGGLEIQLSGAGDRGGLEELLGVLTMGRYGWWWLKPKEERSWQPCSSNNTAKKERAKGLDGNDHETVD